MKRNMGSADRLLRLLFALLVPVLYLTDSISGTLAIILGVVAIIFLATSAMGFCPLYVPFKLSTRKKEA
jgi:hypothetical protein